MNMNAFLSKLVCFTHIQHDFGSFWVIFGFTRRAMKRFLPLRSAPAPSPYPPPSNAQFFCFSILFLSYSYWKYLSNEWSRSIQICKFVNWWPKTCGRVTAGYDVSYIKYRANLPLIMHKMRPKHSTNLVLSNTKQIKQVWEFFALVVSISMPKKGQKRHFLL